MNTTTKLCTLAFSIGVTSLLFGCGGQPGQPATSAAETSAQAAAPESAPTTPTTSAPVASAPAASGQADTEIDQQISSVLGGNPKAYHEIFEHLQKSLAAGDKAGVAALVSYPIDVKVAGKSEKFADANALVAKFDQVFTPEISKAIAGQQFSSAFVNAQGLMIGNGEVWISGVCKDTACKTSNVLITAIQSAQP